MNFKIKHVDLNGKDIPDISKIVLSESISLTIYQIIRREKMA